MLGVKLCLTVSPNETYPQMRNFFCYVIFKEMFDALCRKFSQRSLKVLGQIQYCFDIYLQVNELDRIKCLNFSHA